MASTQEAPPAAPARVRKNIAELTPQEVQQLRNAFHLMQQSGAYDRVCGIGGVPQMQSIHGGPRFLPWHRAYLRAFETSAFEFTPTSSPGPVGSPLPDWSSLTLPVWDWTAPDSQRIPPIFEERLSSGDNPLASVPLPPNIGGGGTGLENAATTVRRPGQTGVRLPTRREVERILAFDDYATFAAALEQISNLVHVWVGGHMGLVSHSAYDPLFWVHQAMIDRIWWSWQQAHPDVVPLGKLMETQLEPFKEPVAYVWDLERTGVTYLPMKLKVGISQLTAGAGNDRPALEDALGFRHYAAAFAEIIASPTTEPPLTIGIFGSWGMGKSTLLDSIVREIQHDQANTEPEPNPAQDPPHRAPFIHVVRFNAWDYSAQEAIWPALVRAVMDQIENDIPWGGLRRFRTLFVRNITRQWKRNKARIAVGAILLLMTAVVAVAALGFSVKAAGTGLVVLGVGGLLKVAVDTASNPASEWIASLFQQRNYGQRVVELEDIREDLKFLEARLQKETRRERRVLIVIDDLDRCEPDQAVEVLQAISRLLDLRSFIVCMGIDARIVTAAIQQHYKGLLEQAGASGYEYLDKIVQIPFRIPEPHPEQMADFLASQLPIASPVTATDTPSAGPWTSASATSDTDAASSEQATGGVPYTASESQLDLVGVALGERVPFAQEELDAFNALCDYLRPNPRHVKRLINVYRLVRTLGESRLREPPTRDAARLLLDNPHATIRWLVLSSQWPFTARALVTHGRERERESTHGSTHDTSLGELLRSVCGTHLTDGQERYDDDPKRLEAFIKESSMTWRELRVICDYTINFNPAVEYQLRHLPATTHENS